VPFQSLFLKHALETPSRIQPEDATSLLIPEYDAETEAQIHINQIWEDIVVEELYGWCTNHERCLKGEAEKCFGNGLQSSSTL